MKRCLLALLALMSAPVWAATTDEVHLPKIGQSAALVTLTGVLAPLMAEA